MSQCKIHLENYTGTFYAGSEIRGRIECYFNEETTLRGIKIKIQCKEHNEWNGTESYRDPADNSMKTRHVVLTGDNTVLDIHQTIFGSDSGQRQLSRGRHVYPFSFHLPYEIPSSFHGPHGSIIYRIKAVVDRPMRIDYEDEFIINVVSLIDFNRMSKDLQDTTSYSDEKTVCCWCCKGGDVTMEVELPKIAFVPGENIPFKIFITNMSNSNVEKIDVKFTKTVTYKVTEPSSETKEDVDDILTFSDHGVGAHGEHTFNMQLAIPQFTEVPNFTKCNLFKVSYALNVTAEMPACTLDLDVTAWDIHMGHVQCTTQSPGGGYSNPPGPQPVLQPPPGPQPVLQPPPGGAYQPVPGGVYPPPYPPPAVATPGFYPPPSGGEGYPYTPGFTAGPSPSPMGPSAPSAPVDDNPKAREAMGGPLGPASNVMNAPPPSYSQVQQSSNLPYPPQ